MKKIFSDSVLTVSAGIFACSLAVGLALVYAFDKFIKLRRKGFFNLKLYTKFRLGQQPVQETE